MPYLPEVNLKEILFSWDHIEAPFEYPIQGGVLSTKDKKAKIVALSILAGLATFWSFGFGGVALFFYLAAKEKMKKINIIDSPAVTYQLNGQRLDTILCDYVKALWVARKNKWPLLYRPFEHADKLNLENMDYKYQGMAHRFENHHKISKSADLKSLDFRSALLVIQSKAEVTPDFTDPEFKKEVKRLIRPKKVTKFPAPQGSVSIALHVRKGGQEEHHSLPSKFPSEEFYVSGIRKVAEMYPGKPLYAFLFTDDPNPASLAENYRKQLPGLNIEFGYKKESEKSGGSILDDLFAMAQCEALIKPESNFSDVAAMIGDHKAIIQPSKVL